jgi:hypothetical protein
MKQVFLRPKDMPAVIKEHFGYELTLATLNRWRRKRPLCAPARLTELCAWFERRMSEKRGPLTLPRRRKATRR